MGSDMAKYRWRTKLRMYLPWSLIWLVPKGSKDCGDHEWARSDAVTWRCFHCKVGVTHDEPWSPIESVEVKLGALRATLRLGDYRPLTPRERQQAATYAKEADQRLHEIRETLNASSDPAKLASLR